MELDSEARLMCRIKIRELKPKLREEVQELAREMNYERTLKASSSLSFLFRLYEEEKAKKSRSRKLLKKAEKMILKLAGLHHDSQSGAAQGKKKAKRGPKRIPKPAQFHMALSKKITDVFASIGITDRDKMLRIIGTIGERKVEERAELLLASDLGEETVKALLGKYDAMLIQPLDDIFVIDIEMFEKKKNLLELVFMKGMMTEPPDLTKDPELLLLNAKELSEILGLGEPKPTMQKDSGGLIPAMTTKAFIKVMEGLGCRKLKRATHGTFYEYGDEEGNQRMILIQNPHKGQDQMDKSVMREKLRELGITIEQFNASRSKKTRSSDEKND